MRYVKSIISSAFPFLDWFPLTRKDIQIDAIAGLTVALLLIPQSMANAQLAGLPPFYGLYAAFVPLIVAALWGSSKQLSTGPVAITSILTASMLTSFALPASQQYIEYAVLLAFIVGLIILTLGIFRLGFFVNFISAPVLIGFTNAAVIVIIFAQLNKFLGVHPPHTGTFLGDIWDTLMRIEYAHLPTVAMGTLAVLIIVLLKKYAPALPAVLIAVVVTTFISWATGFENKRSVQFSEIGDSALRQQFYQYAADKETLSKLEQELSSKKIIYTELESELKKPNESLLTLKYQIDLLEYRIQNMRLKSQAIEDSLRLIVFELINPQNAEGAGKFYSYNEKSGRDKSDGFDWKIISIEKDTIIMTSGGLVVGEIPQGLPEFKAPKIDPRAFFKLFPGALVIAFVGFIEANTIAKAIAAKTRQRLNVNQELIGQGLANIAGSFSQSYPVSGSFARSALNFSMNARTGMSSIFAGIVIMLVLLYFTPLLYHLPQTVLAAVIMTAVWKLFHFRPIIEAWKASMQNGVAAVVTFLGTLIFAPHLDKGIYAGVIVSIVFILARNMRPRIAILGRHPDGTLRDAKVYNLKTCKHIAVIRFDGSLIFTNTAYFEETILNVISSNKKLEFIIVIGDGINNMDYSGAEVVSNIIQHCGEAGVTLVFSGLKKQIMEVFERLDIVEKIGEENIFRTERRALNAVYKRIKDPKFDPEKCPLRKEVAAAQA